MIIRRAVYLLALTFSCATLVTNSSAQCMSCQYQQAAQAYRNAAAQCQNPAGRSCMLANANYYDCVAAQFGPGGASRSCTQPSCSTACTGGGSDANSTYSSGSAAGTATQTSSAPVYNGAQTISLNSGAESNANYYQGSSVNLHPDAATNVLRGADVSKLASMPTLNGDNGDDVVDSASLSQAMENTQNTVQMDGYGAIPAPPKEIDFPKTTQDAEAMYTPGEPDNNSGWATQDPNLSALFPPQHEITYYPDGTSSEEYIPSTAKPIGPGAYEVDFPNANPETPSAIQQNNGSSGQSQDSATQGQPATPAQDLHDANYSGLESDFAPATGPNPAPLPSASPIPSPSPSNDSSDANSDSPGFFDGIARRFNDAKQNFNETVDSIRQQGEQLRNDANEFWNRATTANLCEWDNSCKGGDQQ